MKISQIRKYRKKYKLLPRMTFDNPLLILGLDLPFIVVAANSVKNAVAFSIQMFMIHIVTMLVAYAVAKKLKVWQRVFVTTTIATGMMLASSYLVIRLIPNIMNSSGMYIYLMGVNGVTIFQANFLSKKASFESVVKTSFLNATIFSGAMLAVSLVREYLSNGTVYGIQLPYLVKLTGVAAPFFGFIMVGFLLAVSRTMTKSFAHFRILENVRKDKQSRLSREVK